MNIPANADRALVNLDGQIHALELQLADLKEQRNLITSPLCRAPNEILENIILEAHVAASERSTIHMPICRRIRSSIIHVPDMWCTLSIGKRNLKFGQQWVDLCLERGHGRPITLHVTVPCVKDEDCIPFVVDSLVPYTRAISLQGTNWEKIRQKFLGGSWPALERLDLSMPYCYGQTVIDSYLLGGSSSTLTYLSLTGKSWSSDRIITGFPALPQLLHLKLFEVTAVDCYEHIRSLLTSTSRLLSFSLSEPESSTQFFKPNEVPHGPPASLPELSSLSLSCTSPRTLSSMRELFPLPREELTVHFKRQRLPRGMPWEYQTTHHLVLDSLLDHIYHHPSAPEQHKLVFQTAAEDPVGGWIGFVLAPIRTDDDMRRMGGLMTLDAACPLDMVSGVISFASMIEISDYSQFEFILNSALKRRFPANFTHLSLKEQPKSQLESDAHIHLEEFLRTRKSMGCPLTTLSFEGHKDAKWYRSKLKNAWLEENLITEIYQGGKKWIPTGKSSTSS